MGEQWIEIIVTTPSGVVERAEAALHMATPLGLYIEDYSDLEQSVKTLIGADAGPELIDSSLMDKDRNSSLIHVYFQPGQSLAECAAIIRGCMARAGFAENEKEFIKNGSGGFKNDSSLSKRPQSCKYIYTITAIKGVSEEDWANNWKQYFKPLRVGKGILIMPEWEDEGRVEPGAMVGVNAIVRIDPGMAFGTGGHASTRLCLELAERYINKIVASEGKDGGAQDKRLSVLDLGCGSGILSIAAIKLGAHLATGVDIDAYAVRNAKENAVRNGVEGNAGFHCGDLLNGIKGQYNIIFANIIADVIIRLLNAGGGTDTGSGMDIGGCLLPGGVFIVSGIISEREADVMHAAAKAGYRAADTLRGEGWVAIALVKG